MKERQVRRASKTNLSPEEWKAIKSLRSDNSIMIISADKGNKTVILDKDLYLAKLRDRTSAHNLTNSDPAIAHEDALNAAIDIIMASTSNIKDKPELILRRSELKRFMTKDAFSPWLHGLIKLHKQGFPLREICSWENAQQNLRGLYWKHQTPSVITHRSYSSSGNRKVWWVIFCKL